MHNREEKYSIRKFKNTTASTRIGRKIVPALMSVFCLTSISSNVSNAQQGLGNLGPWMEGLPADAEHFVEFEFNFNDCYVINKYPAGTFKFLKDKPVGQAVPVNVYDGFHSTKTLDEAMELYKKEGEKGYINLKPLNIVDTKDDKIFAKKLADGTELLQYTANAPKIKESSLAPFLTLAYNNSLYGNGLTKEDRESNIYILKNEGIPTKNINSIDTVPFYIVVEERGGENSLAETGVPYKLFYHNTHNRDILTGDIERLKTSGLMDNKTVIYEYPVVNFINNKEVKFADFSIPKGYKLTKEEILSYMTSNIPNFTIDKSKINITEKVEYRTEGEGMDSREVRVEKDYFTFTDNNNYSSDVAESRLFTISYSGELEGVDFQPVVVEVVDSEEKTVKQHTPAKRLIEPDRPCVIRPLSMEEGMEYSKVPNTYPTWEMPSIEIPEIPNTPPNTTDNEGTPPSPPEPDPEPDKESKHPNTYPTWELPEAKIEEIPPIPPTTTNEEGEPDPEPDKETKHPNTYPTWELPEINLDFKVPNTYPTIEKPEANLDFKIPNTYPTWEMPSIEFPTKPTPPPVVPEDKIEIPPKEKELPKTNTNSTYMYTLTSLVGLSLLLSRRKQHN